MERKPSYEEGEPVRLSVQRKTSSMLKPRKNKEKDLVKSIICGCVICFVTLSAI